MASQIFELFTCDGCGAEARISHRCPPYEHVGPRKPDGWITVRIERDQTVCQACANKLRGAWQSLSVGQEPAPAGPRG